jgi:hypothetical protein
MANPATFTAAKSSFNAKQHILLLKFFQIMVAKKFSHLPSLYIGVNQLNSPIDQNLALITQIIFHYSTIASVMDMLIHFKYL